MERQLFKELVASGLTEIWLVQDNGFLPNVLMVDGVILQVVMLE